MFTNAVTRPTHSRTNVRFAWALLAFYLVLQTAALVLVFWGRLAPTPPDAIPLLPRVLLYLPGVVVDVIVGTLIAVRHPRNPIGWFFRCGGLLTAFGMFAEGYWNYALFVRPGSLPGAEFMLWVSTRPYQLAVICSLLVVLCFPTGRPPSPRWWIAGWCFILGNLVNFVALALMPGVLDPRVAIMNPLGLAAAANVLRIVADLGTYTLLVGVLGAAMSIIVRLRRARGGERQQIKLYAYALVLYAAAIGLVLFFVSAPSETLSPSANVAFVAQAFAGVLVSVAAGIAILRYRLWDIDIIIRRTLVYSALTLLLGATYLLGVVALQALFVRFTGQENALAVVASTLAIAALFGPLRRRLQQVIDRRFFRRKYDARLVLDQFALRAQQQADIDALAGDIVGVVDETLQPERARLWLVPTKEQS